ncbi:MAG: class I SAM-dependent methyltransferase [Roseitalea sp.]|nr:class I SAM-dependent methyltransferase [Roseitalea sp.]MBO6950912.1 class I SAM-dependent methyltransferase [Rhizobiaceae bacterium]MBO6591101.1 class I SAM-dependent methyltransferase [Roseitalea sp.]MBO6599641.1 class I SAM-dependent methyltransferase [Roseitalea sp.]MBO6613892.1 class I SAM-dependent methyltransferase [Roseitalea sp.]
MNTETAEMRYGFGQNWAEFVDQKLSDSIIEESRVHLAEMLRTDDLSGKTFLDIGCGSGIHSLAALRLGAKRVIAFDYDEDSVATARRVHAFAGAPDNWEIMQGSVLDEAFMKSLPVADIVYSWGVLHHTGDMWRAVRNAGIPLADDSVFYIALYSSDNYVDPPPSYWLKVKRAYNLAPQWRKSLMEMQYMLRWHFLPEIKAGRNPWALMKQYGSRGMTYWTDVKDWLGGWPMDFASLNETQAFCDEEFGLSLMNVKTGEGCTEYVFARPDRNEQWRKVVESRTLIPLEGPFNAAGGKSYSKPLPALTNVADDMTDPRRSRLMLYEDGKPLGLSHSIHDHISRFAGGRFCHWGETLYFSASDGSDPNQNGRSYAYCERF